MLMMMIMASIKMKSLALLLIILASFVLFASCAAAAQPEDENDEDGEDEMAEVVTSPSASAASAATASTEPSENNNNKMMPSSSTSADPNTDQQSSSSSSSSASSTTVDLSPDTVEKESKTKDEEEYEDDEDDDYEDDSGPILLSQFVRRFNTSAFVPTDYAALAEELEHASATSADTGESLSSILSAKFRHINDTIAVLGRAQAFGERLLAGSKDLKDTALYISSLLSDRMVEAKLSSQCTADIANIGQGLQKRKMWAAKFIDAWGNLPSGLMAGHMSSLGEYEQCLSIRSGARDTGELGRRIYGKYCPVQMRMITPSLADFQPSFEAIIEAHPAMATLREMALAVDLEDREEEQLLPPNIKGINIRPFLGFKLAQSVSEGYEVMRGAAGLYGVCFPSSCTAEDLERLFNFIVYPLTGIPLQVKEKYCSVHEEAQPPLKLDRYQQVAVVVFALAGTLVVFSTAIHALLLLVNKVNQQHSKATSRKAVQDKNGNASGQLFDHGLDESNNEVTVTTNGNDNTTISINIGGSSDSKKPQLQKAAISSPGANQDNQRSECSKVARQLLLSFSAIANSKSLFSFNNRHAVLDTLRFSMTVIIFAVQAFGFTAGMSVQTLRSMLYTAPVGMGGGLRYWWLRCPGLWNDGFVFTFGVTLVFQQFNRLSKVGASFNYLAYLLRRWFRLSFSVMGILMAMYLFPLVGDGPYWFNVDNQLVDACREPAIIRSLFGYYSNWNVLLRDYQPGAYFPICSFPTWFLSMSTQLYLVAPIFFLSMYFYPTCGVTLTVLVLLLSPLSTLAPRLSSGAYSYVELTKLKSVRDMYLTIQHYHMNPALYITSFTIGCLTGYLIKEQPRLRIPGGYLGERVLWLASFIGAAAIFVWFDAFFGDYRVENTATEAMAWWIVSKFVFPSFLGVTCFLCCTGRGGLINRILTVRAIQPIAKLSFGIYLLRSLTIYYRIGTVRHTYPFYYWQAWQNIFFDYFTAAVLSYFLHILFDGPAMGLIRLFETVQLDGLFGKGRRETTAAAAAAASIATTSFADAAKEVIRQPSQEKGESSSKSMERFRKVIQQSFVDPSQPSSSASPPSPPSPPPSLASLKKVK